MRSFARAVWPAAVAATVVGLVLVVAVVGDDVGPAGAERETFLQVNICGNACNDGGLDVVARVEEAIGARTPRAVTLNEVCENQYVAFETGLHMYTGRFDPTGPRCHNGARYGNAVFVRAGALSLVGSWRLPDLAGDEARGLMCVQAHPTGLPVLVVCVTHISNLDANVGGQVRAVAGFLGTVVAGLPAGAALLLGGDFNTDPDDVRLDPLYELPADPAGHRLREVEASRGPVTAGEATRGPHKYDDIFLSAEFSSTTAEVTDATRGRSDHRALWAVSTLVRATDNSVAGRVGRP